MSKDCFRIVIEAPLYEAGIFGVYVVRVREDAPVEFHKSVNFKNSFYCVRNNNTGVLEYETPTFVEARMIAYLANKQCALSPEEETAAWPSAVKMLGELPEDVLN